MSNVEVSALVERLSSDTTEEVIRAMDALAALVREIGDAVAHAMATSSERYFIAERSPMLVDACLAPLNALAARTDVEHDARVYAAVVVRYVQEMSESADLLDLFDECSLDVMGLILAHLTTDERQALHERMLARVESLDPEQSPDAVAQLVRALALNSRGLPESLSRRLSDPSQRLPVRAAMARLGEAQRAPGPEASPGSPRGAGILMLLRRRLDSNELISQILAMMALPKPRYFADAQDPFDALVGFVTGFQTAIAWTKTRDPDGSIPLFVPTEFTAFVGKELGHDPDDDRWWATRIRENTTSGEEAFRLFVDLRLRFESQRSAS